MILVKVKYEFDSHKEGSVPYILSYARLAGF